MFWQSLDLYWCQSREKLRFSWLTQKQKARQTPKRSVGQFLFHHSPFHGFGDDVRAFFHLFRARIRFIRPNNQLFLVKEHGNAKDLPLIALNLPFHKIFKFHFNNGIAKACHQYLQSQLGFGRLKIMTALCFRYSIVAVLNPDDIAIVQ